VTTRVVRPACAGQEGTRVPWARGAPAAVFLVRRALAPLACRPLLSPSPPALRADRPGWCGWCGDPYARGEALHEAGPGVGLAHAACAHEAARVAARTGGAP
jgi:hypothetical protein